MDAFNNDAAYIKALTGTDENEINKAWVCLYTTYQKYIGSVLTHLGMEATKENIKDAEDAYAESIIVVVNAIRNRTFIPGTAKISTYLFTCCKHLLLGIKRSRTRFVDQNYTSEEEIKKRDEINLTIIDESESEYIERVKTIKHAVAELRPSCADILHRVLYEGQEYELIAKSKSFTLRYVEVEFSRCKKLLVDLLISKYKFPPGGIWL